jgi:hypothetical protein
VPVAPRPPVTAPSPATARPARGNRVRTAHRPCASSPPQPPTPLGAWLARDVINGPVPAWAFWRNRSWYRRGRCDLRFCYLGDTPARASVGCWPAGVAGILAG